MLTDYTTVQAEIIQLIAVQKNIALARILPNHDLSQLGVDALDLFELILKVENTYRVNIPDAVPLFKPEDFVNYIFTVNLKNAG